METIDRWLKSLRLHKYTHLFKTLTYEQMLNLEEKYLIGLDITKGARNKILVSVKKLNLRRERLLNMIDDIEQDNISHKEALNVLKEMLITPIPTPEDNLQCNPSEFPDMNDAVIGLTKWAPQPLGGQTANGDTAPKPHELTHLFVDTFEKVIKCLIMTVGIDDSACHGIVNAIVDECSKHNSFTKEQKATVASFKQLLLKEQKARMVSIRQLQHQSRQQHKPAQVNANHTTNSHYNHNTNHTSQNLNQLLNNQHNQTLQDSYRHGGHHQHYNHTYNAQLRNGLPHQPAQHYHYHQGHGNSAGGNTNSNFGAAGFASIGSSQPHYNSGKVGFISAVGSHHYQHNNHWSAPTQSKAPPSLSASLSTTGSASVSTTSDEEEQRPVGYREYSLLGPGISFELPWLRALVAGEKRTGGSGRVFLG